MVEIIREMTGREMTRRDFNEAIGLLVRRILAEKGKAHSRRDFRWQHVIPWCLAQLFRSGVVPSQAGAELFFLVGICGDLDFSASI